MGRESRLSPFARDSRQPAAAVVRDKYNRILREGDQVYVAIPGVPQQPYTIESITEILDLNVPNAHRMLDVTVRSRLRFHCDKDQIADAFVRIREASEQATAALAAPPANEAQTDQGPLGEFPSEHGGAPGEGQ